MTEIDLGQLVSLVIQGVFVLFGKNLLGTLKKMQTSIADLNAKMAVVLERTGNHKEAIENLEGRLARQEVKVAKISTQIAAEARL